MLEKSFGLLYFLKQSGNEPKKHIYLRITVDGHFRKQGTAEGVALVMKEATAESAEGRCSPEDPGIRKEAHIEKLQHIASFIKLRQ
jgi:hypothetical protein